MNDMHTPDIDLNLLHVFYAVFETKNVSVAADRLQLSQSAASHAISRLRKQLGDPLFVRTAVGMQATPFAEQLAKPIGEALESLRTSVRSAREFEPATSCRRFKIYLSDIGQVLFLPGLLAHFKVHAPGVTLKMPPVPMRDSHLALETGEVDLAVGHFTTLVAGFHQKKLFRERYVCVVRSGHPNFRDGMTLDAFQASDHAIADSSGMAHQLLDRALDRHGVRRQFRLVVPEFMVLPLIIQNSDLLVVMPSRLADQFSRLLSLQILPLPVNVSSYDIQIYWHERYHQDPANRWLRAAITELFAERASALPAVGRPVALR
jgi:DNA-binding transcriptional LysR family regulator